MITGKPVMQALCFSYGFNNMAQKKVPCRNKGPLTIACHMKIFEYIGVT